jgi:hypothetical protein
MSHATHGYLMTAAADRYEEITGVSLKTCPECHHVSVQLHVCCALPTLKSKKTAVVTVYDTLDHQIGGVSQQQGSGGSLTFTSQYGTVSVSSLPIVSVDLVTQCPDSVRLEKAPKSQARRP